MSSLTTLPNIGPRQRRVRLTSGVVGIAAGVIGLVALIAFDAPRMWRLLLFFPFGLGALGVLQYRGKT